MKKIGILLVDADPSAPLGAIVGKTLASSFDLYMHRWKGDSDRAERRANDILDLIRKFTPSVTFLVLPSTQLTSTCQSVFRSLAEGGIDTPTIVVTEETRPERLFSLLEWGAVDFVTPPIRATDVLPRVWRLVGHTTGEDKLTRDLKVTMGLREIVGRCPAFVQEINKLPVIARCDVNVLITGETGTGKELCARAIHYLSPRRRKIFMPVNCGAIPTELIENELFGHERGAFTGAVTSHAGLVQEADGGTLFLDEIDSLPLGAQVKLLRFLEDKEYRRLGSARPRKADVRVLAATNVDLAEQVGMGRFRQDLYYRLNIIPLALPPLRERREDIPLLARTFLTRHARKFGKKVTAFSPDAMKRLVLYDWPGNVRELEHVVERAAVLSEKSTLETADLSILQTGAPIGEEPFQEAKAKVIARFEEDYIKRLLEAHDGNITHAARAAQKNRRAFWELMRKHRIKIRSARLREA